MWFSKKLIPNHATTYSFISYDKTFNFFFYQNFLIFRLIDTLLNIFYNNIKVYIIKNLVLHLLTDESQ